MRSSSGVRRSRLRGAVLAVTAALATASCAGLPSSGEAPVATLGTVPPSSVTAPPSGQTGLAKFYGQKLSWSPCELAQCAWLQVPVDYTKPDGDTIKLRVLKVPARGSSKGALFVNPGGPGGSAVAYAQAANFIVSADIRASYDIVGVDPRGVGQSNPIVCFDDRQMDDMLGADPTPDTPAELAEVDRYAKEFAAACQAKYPKLLPFLGTVDVAKDMDVARAALGQERMVYLGKSYGTLLGLRIAQAFPDRVGRFVLDGVMDPALTDQQLSLGQAAGFEMATRAYMQDCVDKGACPLGDSLESGMQGLRDLLKQLDASPLPVNGDPYVKKLTEAWGSFGVALGMYDEGRWPAVTTALRSAKKGDGTDLFRMALDYADRDRSGTYTTNIMQVISAVNCLDHPVLPQTEAEREASEKEFSRVAPTWGPFMAGSSFTCLNWPVKPTVKKAPIAAKGAPLMVLVGTTRDPATPYVWAQSVSKQLADSRLITWDGDGHTAYHRSNSCVDKAVDAFYLNGTPPPADLKC